MAKLVIVGLTFMKEMRSSEISNLAIISGIAFIAISPLYFFGALSVQITNDLSYKPSLHGFGSTSFYLVAAFFAVNLGRIADYANPILTLKLSMLIIFISSAGITFSKSLLMVCFFLAIGGFGSALATPGIAKFVQDRFESRRQGLAYGFKQSATGLSTLIGGAAIPFVASNGQWRIVFALGSLFSLFIFFKLNEVPSEVSLVSKFIAFLKPAVKTKHPKVKYSLQVQFIAISFALGAAVGIGIITYMPLSLADAGLSASESSFTIIFASLGSLISRFAVLLFMDRTRIDSIKICIAMMAIGSIGIIGLATMEKDFIVSSAFVSYAFGWGWVGLITYKMLRISDDNLGANVGLVQSAAAVGSIFGPITLAAVYELSGFRLMWQLSSAALIASLLFLVASQMAEKIKLRP